LLYHLTVNRAYQNLVYFLTGSVQFLSLANTIIVHISDVIF